MSLLTLEELREDEARYRRRGCYELAVQYQRQADLVEAGQSTDECLFQFFDRGAIKEIEWGRHGDLLGLRLPSGLAWALTPDSGQDLWSILTIELGITPETLRRVARAIERAEQAS